MSWDKRYDRFLSFSAWVGVVLYVAPGVVLLAGLKSFDVPSAYWLPLFVLYGVGAISHQLGWGFQAVNIQTKVAIDYAVAELKRPAGAESAD